MAHPTTDLHFPPSYSKRFTTYPRTVSGSPNVDAPAKIYHMPCQVVVEISAADQHFDYTDNNGTSVVMPFKVAGNYTIRMAFNTIDAGTTAASVTVYWQAPLSNL